MSGLADILVETITELAPELAEELVGELADALKGTVLKWIVEAVDGVPLTIEVDEGAPAPRILIKRGK